MSLASFKGPTVVDVAAEKNSTLVMPFPVELLRFFDQATPQAAKVLAQAAQVLVADETDSSPQRPTPAAMVNGGSAA